ncbi:ubiquitin fusion degradation protein UFD1-domain-containing protein [Protomyces lactucae-debilis]|uniref:Ubiquitin fusion degradation protein UFD1-domain-containing protein n=1 Tax=Protomyces lactucae-debilis TaxID=2754530 RepID=A0A1Y2EVA4_PROLT|nr:ubiquitin fusion degradation protein UFD1-domain-containing protein [Protomyces lactucae-debilis]ORY75447.1 ubiquitin fusion degradation protein UFD1-domain-containing protein [Protomyces lactucae-debilis]
MLQMKQMVLLAVKGSKTLPDASDKCILPQSILEALLQGHAHGQLPSPLTFAVRSHAGRLTHVGVQEFDADEGTVVFPPVVLDNLGITASTRDGKDLRDVAAHQVTITHTILPKGEYVLLRPFASGYSLTTDWKTALEGAFRSAYTCLTKGDIVRLRGRSERFLVDALKPEDAQGVCIVDTDLEVDLTPLSDQHAQETLDANVQQEVAPPLVLGEQVAGSSTAQYTLSTWDRSAPLYISAQAEADAELVMDTHPEPTLHRHIWSDLRGCVRKTIDIFPGNTALQSSDTLYLSITGAHTLTVSQQRQPKTIPETHKQCPNCNEAIPAANLFLHERHCVRNTKRCAVCHQPHAITRPHQHCEVCGEVYEGSSAYHIERLHTPQTSLAAQHRATTCSLRLRGDLSTLGYMDKERGFTPHEVECGARTIQCDVMGCRRLIKLKDVATHQRFHDSQRLTRNLPKCE